MDGSSSIFRVNVQTSAHSDALQPSQDPPEEDSVSVQYDSDQFAVEYELEPSDDHSDSEHSSANNRVSAISFSFSLKVCCAFALQVLLIFTNNMPVSGLPATLEVTLTSLLQENAISSWKIVSEGAKSTVVLRLCSNDFIPNMATTMDSVNMTGRVNKVSYRRKPPSQYKRDFLRASNFRERNRLEGERELSENFLFSSPNFGFRPTHQEESVYSDTGSVGLSADGPNLCTAQNFEGAPSSELDVQAVQAGAGLDKQLACDNGIDSATCFDANYNEMERKAMDNEVSPEQVKEYIGSLKDKSVESKLKNNKRNNRFLKYTLDNSSLPPTLLCESDDFVVQVKTDVRDSNDMIKYWLIKQNRSFMSEEELEYLAKLEQGQPAERGKFWRSRKRAEAHMKSTRDLAVFYYN